MLQSIKNYLPVIRKQADKDNRDKALAIAMLEYEHAQTRKAIRELIGFLEQKPLKIKKLVPEAVIPEYKTKGAVGMDLTCLTDLKWAPKETIKVGTGIALEIPEGYEVQIRPRSSMTAKGVLAGFGTIDQDYRGEVIVTLTNVSKQWAEIPAGSRIAQIVVSPLSQNPIEVVDEIAPTERGDGGFGSTGE